MLVGYAVNGVWTRRKIATRPETSITTGWLWGQVHSIVGEIAPLAASFRLHHDLVGSWFTVLKEFTKSSVISAK
jgi:hypothetical protein